MPRILIIDDEEPIRTFLRLILERAGYEVDEACNGAEGLQHYQTFPTDMIITDVVMPGQAALEIVRTLRQVDPQAKILAISGGGQTGSIDLLHAAEALGAQGTLQKPFSRRALLDAVCGMIQAA
jgi:CheY-like chemotaxis protein